MLGHDSFFVLTGGPGAGKTTLIEVLKARGYATTEEAGRGVIRQQVPMPPAEVRRLTTKRPGKPGLSK